MTKTTTTTTNDSTQQRATCSACFAQQAIRKSGKLVPHGYTRPQHWHQNVGTCTGAGVMHFGTEKGRDYTIALALRLRENADAMMHRATEVECGRANVLTTERVKGTRRVVHEVVVENPTQRMRDDYARALRRHAELMREQASELEALIAKWKPVAPISVAVEAKVQIIHFHSQRMRGKLCAASMMGAQKGWTTSERANVNCEKCLARLVEHDARVAAKKSEEQARLAAIANASPDQLKSERVTVLVSDVKAGDVVLRGDEHYFIVARNEQAGIGQRTLFGKMVDPQRAGHGLALKSSDRVVVERVSVK